MLANEMRELAKTAISVDGVISELANEIRAYALAGKFNLTAEIKSNIVGNVRAYFQERGFVVQNFAYNLPEGKTIINISWE